MLPDRWSFRGLSSPFVTSLPRRTVAPFVGSMLHNLGKAIMNQGVAALVLAVVLCAAGRGTAMAQTTLIDYGLLDAVAALQLNSATNPLQLQGAVFFSDGMISNVNSPCLVSGSGVCSITSPSGFAIALLTNLPPSTEVSWSTDAPASDGTLVVDTTDPRLANFTSTAASTYHVLVSVPHLSPMPVTITINSVPSVTANPGSSETVNINSVATLDGSSSTSFLGAPLSYQWFFVSTPSGSQAVLNNPTSVNPTFTADRPGEYVVQLTVSALIEGVPVSNSANVIVSTTVVAPIADAGTAQTVHPIATAILDGSQSFDPNGLLLTYSWTLAPPAGSNAVLSDPTAVKPSFTVDVLGTYTATLVVNNGFLTSNSSSVTVNTSNSAPLANAGTSQSVSVGAQVVLNGSGSSDPDDDPLTYRWSLVSIPSGSHAILSSANSVSPSFVPDLPGTYVVGLIVTDGFVDSPQSTVQVLAIATVTSVIQGIRDLQNTITELPSASFRNRNMQNALLNKLNAAISAISSGDYHGGVSQLENDVLGKTDGCKSIGSPSGTDWITDCTAQESIDAQILSIISELNGLQ